jgi:hypothetical protein
MRAVLSAFVVMLLPACTSHPTVSDPTERATVMIFVTIDCPISNRMVPEINRLCEQYSNRGIDFQVVYADPDLSADDVKKHHDEYAIKCPAIMDPKHERVNRAGVTVTPEAAVFTADGKLVYRGRINDLYMDFGRARQAPTTHDLRDVLDAVVHGNVTELKTTKAVGCPIPM